MRVAVVNGVKQFQNDGEILARTNLFLGAGIARVGEQVVEIRLLAANGFGRLIGRVVGRDGLLHNVQLAHGNTHDFGKFQDCWRPRFVRFKFARFHFPTRDQLHHVSGNVNGLLRVDQGSLDGLLDPPTCVRAEARALRWIKSLGGAD